MPISPITLIIADAHAITRNGLIKTLQAEEEVSLRIRPHTALVECCAEGFAAKQSPTTPSSSKHKVVAWRKVLS